MMMMITTTDDDNKEEQQQQVFKWINVASYTHCFRLPYKLVPNPFCIISLNQVKVARTKVKTGPDPVWDEEFVLE